MKNCAWNFAFALWLLASTFAAAQTTIQMSPLLVRQAATQAPLPLYPKVSIQSQHQGVSVAEILISDKGIPLDVKVLQAPDQAISNSVTDALRSWRLQAYKHSNKQPMQIRTRLIFYFKLDPPRVIDAQRSEL